MSTKASMCKIQDRSVIILDGGFGHELKNRGCLDEESGMNGFLLGALANEVNPAVVQQLHLEYFQAGCDVITTNSFIVTPRHVAALSGESTPQERCRQIISAAVRCAKQATSQQGRRVQIAGSVPPLGECYRSNCVPTENEMQLDYQTIVGMLIKESVDVLLAETLSTSTEAIAIIDALSAVAGDDAITTIPPLWIALTLDDLRVGFLRSGEPIHLAFQHIFDHFGQAKKKDDRLVLQAIGINCTAPEAISASLNTVVSVAARSSNEIPSPRVLVYANVFKMTTTEWMQEADGVKVVNTWKSQCKDSDFDSDGFMTPQRYAEFAQHWIRLGATIVGGCCGTRPDHIRAIYDSVSD